MCPQPFRPSKSTSMKKTALLSLASFLISTGVFAQQPESRNHLLGEIHKKELSKTPYSEWYDSGYKAYNPNPKIVEKLKDQDLKNYHIEIFLGSWCGDSRREMPRFLKILDEINFPAKKVVIIGVDTGENYKQSPGREERGKAIYRVATFIIYQEGVEKGRIVEYPVFSLERDLLKILEQEPYTPNYYSFPVLTEWQQQGILSDTNIDARGLANQIRSKVSSASELNSAGYVFLARGDLEEAINTFRINVILFPEEANPYDSLGEAYMAAGRNDKALMAYEYAQGLAPENEHIKGMITKLKTLAEGGQQQP